MQTEARVVVIGAGIAGCSVAYHLALSGWRDIVVLDQGPLFHTGGSTSHAPGGLSRISSSRMLAEFARYSVPLYAQLEFEQQKGAVLVGGLEVACTAERWQELQRRAGWAKAFGLEAHLLDARECQAHNPLLDAGKLHGGLFDPGAGVGNAVVACAAMAAAASLHGAASFHGQTAITAIEVTDAKVRAIVTDQGRINTEAVVLAGGIWGPLLGRMAGVEVPLMPLEHQYVRLGPVPELAANGVEVGLPITRIHDLLMYCRQHRELFGVGSYNHAPLPVEPHAIRSHRETSDPSKHAFTPQDFAGPHAQLCELMPALRGRPIVDGFNGMFCFTPDSMPIMGPHPDVQGLWLAEALWITHAAGAGRALAEWLDCGAPSLDLREADVSRFQPHALTRPYVRMRGNETYLNTHTIYHPAEPMKRPRALRHTPFHARYAAQGAHFVEVAGWERAAWCNANASVGATGSLPLRSGWAAQHWSPVQVHEHLLTRSAAALFDMSTFCKIEVEGRDALALLQWVFTNNMDIAPGRVVYTLLLEQHGGIRSDMTVVRLAPAHFRVLSGAGAGPRDLAWLRMHARTRNLEVRIREVTSAYGALGIWGPHARAVLAGATDAALHNSAFPYYSAQPITVGMAPCLAMRVSYVGELGWELYTPAEYSLHVWDALWEAGRAYGLIAAGTGAMDSLRIEKGYRRLTFDTDANITPFEVDLLHVVRWKKGDFCGRAALLARRDTPPEKKLACLTLDRARDVVLGREPVLHAGKPVGYVTSANSGYSVGRNVAYALLPAALAVPGCALEIEYFGAALPATVAAEPLFDPDGARLRA
jgi:glycine cleavage system aminomethyltransferase T/glycine/D-amino acid oxidase-like deaminating enzyme